LKIAQTSTALKAVGFLAVVFSLYHVTTNRLDYLRSANDAARQGFISAEDRTKQLACLTKNIYHEAGFEPFEGKVAVAQVTMNRVAAGKFGRDVCDVVYSKNVVYQKIICQFSWTCDGKSAVRPIASAHYREAEEIAKKVLLEGFRLPSMKDAMYYHADYVNPQWGKPKINQIGRHIFYKESI
jgi:spore germination cell wall hydrolase CwlJ-like protein